MSEPMYMQGDPIALGNTSEGTQEVECEDCGNLTEVETEEEYSHGDTTWYAEWVCPKCNESHTTQGWY